MTTATDRPQPLIALEKANQVRVAHAETKQWIAAGRDAEASRQRASDLLLKTSSQPHAGSLRVLHMLLAVRGMGMVKTRKILKRHRVHERSVIDDLTDRQRMLLAADLRGARR